MCFWTFVLYGDVSVMRVCIVGADGRGMMWFSWVKWVVSNFLSFSINVDVMRVYIDGVNGLVPSCSWWFVWKVDILWGCCVICFYSSFVCVYLHFLMLCGGLAGRVLICRSILVSFCILKFCLWCCFLVFWIWILCDVNVP